MELCQLTLPSALTIVQVEEYKSSVLMEIEGAHKVMVDDRKLIKVDTTGIQLLLSLLHTIISRGVELEWNSQNDLLKESVKQLGLENSDFKPCLFNNK